MTVTGLNSVELGRLTTWQQFLLFVSFFSFLSLAYHAVLADMSISLRKVFHEYWVNFFRLDHRYSRSKVNFNLFLWQKVRCSFETYVCRQFFRNKFDYMVTHDGEPPFTCLEQARELMTCCIAEHARRRVNEIGEQEVSTIFSSP